MARHNSVHLYAGILQSPKINKTGTRAIVPLVTVQGNRDSHDTQNSDSYTFDCPPLISQNEYFVSEIAKWKPNDIVYIKGVICTRDLDNKKTFCPECGAEVYYSGVITYISPVHVFKVCSMPSREACLENLKLNQEISNNCTVVGNVCQKPAFYQKGSYYVTQYNIALNRKYFIKEDPLDITSDYPHVKSYGENALDDAKFILVGGSVLIDGKLSTKEYDKKLTCDKCGTQFTVKESAMEIVPYEVEYLEGCRSPEEVEEMQSRLSDESFEDVFDVNGEDE